MAGPRKLFRIEHTAAAQLDARVESEQAGLRHAEIMGELRALAATFAAPARPRPSASTAGEPARLTSELNLIAGAIRGAETEDSSGKAADEKAPTSRVESELKAVVDASEQATCKILAAAEEIDAIANNLSAALAGRIEQELAQDIQDLSIKIFEACNFQDLIGQRVAKVMAALNFIEEHIARVLQELKTASAAAQALHGPRLDGDAGHASQDDIDAMFAD